MKIVPTELQQEPDFDFLDKVFKELYADPQCFFNKGIITLYSQNKDHVYEKSDKRDYFSYLEWSYRDINIHYFNDDSYTITNIQDGTVSAVSVWVDQFKERINNPNIPIGIVYKFILNEILLPIKEKFRSYEDITEVTFLNKDN